MLYTLMHKNIPVAALEIDDVILSIPEVYHLEHLPLGVPHHKGVIDRVALNEWWLGRAIPASRSGLRDVLAVLGVRHSRELLVKCLGLSLSDQYWVSPQNKTLAWGDINFFENDFSEDVGNALFGRASGDGNLNLMSPDNTSDGWLKKKWVIADGKRVLLKGGSFPYYQEPFSEVLASRIMDRLGVTHAPYTLTWDGGLPLSACEDFINPDTDLISAWRIFGSQKKPNHFSNYQQYVSCCDTLGIPGIRESLDQMIVVDFLIANTDRHFNNFGVIRNAETLEWLGPAPIFDCGTAMWHDQFTNMIRPGFKLASKPFKPSHGEQIKLVSSFDWLDPAGGPLVQLQDIDEEYSELLKTSAFIDEERRTKLCWALKRRVEMLGEEIAAGKLP
ncbi:hypothetical protein FACS1894109_16420 [Spirochaetia bacterium]|nr:hypothetical protein FACS1894109_16420 [Spirochaetia bacterium]